MSEKDSKAKSPTSKHNSVEDEFSYTEEETFIDPQENTKTEIPAPAQIKEVSSKSEREIPNSEKLVILQPLAEGGHGMVWEGIQKSLKRRLAVKSLKQNDSYDSLSAKLFYHEALITASLEHPNIIPVHDLGEDSEGRPLLAMKLVEGKQWNEVLGEDFSQLSVRDFLTKHIQILISVAQAVAFAHSKGIIHRDLKPPQVMLGRFGEVLLMDWGLAMVYDRSLVHGEILKAADLMLFQPVNPAGTPGYMAPEQTETTTDTLGPRTDVYLLGAILYEILTGFKPHRPSKGKDILEAARKNEIILPEELVPDRDIPFQLSRLALNCMKSEVSERPTDVETFILELQDYLRGSDLRHESMEIVTNVANFILEATTDYSTLAYALDQLDRALTLWPTNHMATQLRFEIMETFARRALDNNDINLAKVYTARMRHSRSKSVLMDRIKEREEQIDKQKEKLDQAISHAEAERGRAEVLVRFLIGDLHAQLRSMGRLDLIHRVAEEALKYFNSLSESGATPGALLNRAVSYMQIGDVLSEQGQRQAAEETYYKAHEIGRLLISRGNPLLEWQIVFADSWNRLGRLHYSMGRTEDARAEHLEAIAIFKEIRKNTDDNEDVNFKICKSYAYMAATEWRAQKLMNAHGYATKALSKARELSNRNPTKITLQNCVTICLTTLANIERDMGSPDKAINYIYEALALKITIAEQMPGNVSITDEVLWTRAQLGSLLFAKGELEQSLETFRADLSERRKLYELERSNVLRLGGLIHHLNNMGTINFLLNRVPEAENFWRECSHLCLMLTEIDTSSPNTHASMGKNYYQLGEVYALRDDWTEAERLAKISIEKCRYAWWMAPTNLSVIIPLCFGLTFHARCLRKLNQYQQSEAVVEEVQTLIKSVQDGTNSFGLPELSVRINLLTELTPEIKSQVNQLKEKRHISPFLAMWLEEYGLE